MENIIKVEGIIHFDPEDKTNKHKHQSSWKKIAMILFDDDICSYYSWFLYKRYNIQVNKPLRGPHISFINDSIKDISLGLNIQPDDVDQYWNEFKQKYDGVKIQTYLDLDIRTNSEHWWLNVPEIYRENIHNIRKEIGLNRPFFGLHLSLGYVNDKNIEQSKYIHSLIQKFGKEYN